MGKGNSLERCMHWRGMAAKQQLLFWVMSEV